nr:germin-like protein subfamily 1 member 20 [Quercus suber]
MANGIKQYQLLLIVARVVHWSGQVNFGPNLNLTCRRQVEGKGTQNRPPKKSVESISSEALVNGKFCKDPKLTTVDDFIFMGLDVPRNTLNQLGSNVTLVNVDMFPGLNTLGIALAHVDYAPYGLNPPHIHPRASKLLTVIEGTLLVGFVTSNPDN